MDKSKERLCVLRIWNKCVFGDGRFDSTQAWNYDKKVSEGGEGGLWMEALRAEKDDSQRSRVQLLQRIKV